MFLSLPSFQNKQEFFLKKYLKFQEQFSENSNMLISLMDQNSDGVFIKDLKGKYIMVNAAAAKILGLPTKKIIGKKDKELISDLDYKSIHADDLRVIKSGKTRVKKEILNLRGQKRTYICTKGVYKNSNNEIIGVICLCRDVTEKETMKQSLQESEKQFKALFDNVPLGIYRTTPKGKILMANPTMLKMLQYSSFEELSKKNLEKDFYEPTYSRKEFRNRLEKEGEIKGLESKCVRKDGSVIYIRENARVVKNKKGEVVCYEGSIEDITERKIAEDAMSRLGAIVQSSQDSIIATNMNDVITNWNLGAEKLYGYTAGEAIGKPIYIIVPSIKKAEMVMNINKIKRGRQVLNLETLRKTKDEKKIFVSVSINPIRDVSGKIIGVASIARDVTDRKRLEKELSNLATIVETSQDCILATNKKGIITNWNHGAEKLYGYTSKEAIGKSVNMIAPPGRKIEIKRIVKKILAGTYLENFETVRVRKSGELVNILVNANPIKDDNGKVLGFASIAKDITLRKVLEEELRFQKNLLELQSEASIEGIVVVSANDKIMSYNSRFLEMWDVGVDNLENSKHKDALKLLVKNVTNAKEFLSKVSTLKKYLQKESTDEIYLKNGKIYERYTTPIKDNKGNFYGRVWYFHDITESKLYEKQRELLIAVAGHELKTPITSIKAFTQILQKKFKDQGDSQVSDYLFRMDDQIEKLTKLTQDLLDVIKIRGGKLDYEKKAVSIQKLVQRCVEDIQKTTNKHKIKIIGNCLSTVYGDPNRLNQVMTNLLGNAIKYSPKGNKILVKISSNDQLVNIQVQDFGLGIPEGYQDKVFKSFIRLTTAKDDVFPGLGLGLYIVSEIVKAHGGKISVESKKGKGSTFSFELPIFNKELKTSKKTITKSDDSFRSNLIIPLS